MKEVCYSHQSLVDEILEEINQRKWDEVNHETNFSAFNVGLLSNGPLSCIVGIGWGTVGSLRTKKKKKSSNNGTKTISSNVC
jgi:hypothetical protein